MCSHHGFCRRPTEALDLARLAALSFADPSHTTNPVKIESAAALEGALALLL